MIAFAVHFASSVIHSKSRRKNGWLFSSLLLFSLVPVHARTFTSALPLKVFEWQSEEIPNHLLGFTPGKGVAIPPNALWYVRPIGNLSDDRLDALIQDVKGNHIEGIDFANRWDITDTQLSRLAQVPQLRLLALKNTRITDQGLEVLPALPDLEVLTLGNQTTDKGLVSLENLKHLRVLDASHTKVTDKGLHHLEHLSTLMSLNLAQTPVHDEGMAALQSLHHLKHLRLGETIGDKGIDYLQNLRELTELDVNATHMTAKGLRSLSHLTNLEVLYLNPMTSDAGLSAISELSHLRLLDITGAPITEKGVSSLVRLHELNELSLSQTHVGDTAAISLGKMTSLKTLDLSYTLLTTEGLSHLTGLNHLETLAVPWTHLTESELQQLAALSRLKTVILNDTPIPDSVFNRLKSLANAQLRPSTFPAEGEIKAPKTSVNTPKPAEKPFMNQEETIRSTHHSPYAKSKSLAPIGMAPDLPPSDTLTHELAPLGHVAPDDISHASSADPIVYQAKPAMGRHMVSLSGLHRLHQLSETDDLQDASSEAPNAPTDDIDTSKPSIGEIHINATHR